MQGQSKAVKIQLTIPQPLINGKKRMYTERGNAIFLHFSAFGHLFVPLFLFHTGHHIFAVMENVRKCPVCGAEIRGRSDKKFCSDLCRHDWHNSRYRSQRLYADRINSILLKNRRILDSLSASGTGSIPVEHLTCMQFNFRVFTSLRRRLFRPTLFYCYDICYYISRRGIVHIKNTSATTDVC